MMPKSVTAKEMSEIDRRAQEEYNISSSILMENAGRSVAETIMRDTLSLRKANIIVFCGKGNNGGDGFVIARYLADKTPGALEVFTYDADTIKPGPARKNYETLLRKGVAVRPLMDFLNDPDAGKNSSITVDAVFGTGFKGELNEQISDLGKKINISRTKLYAVDIPSGLNATTGEASENCFKADITVTFGLPKTGFFTKDGPDVTGRIILKDIGFPEQLLDEYTKTA